MLGLLWSCHWSSWPYYSWDIVVSLSTNLQISFGSHQTILDLELYSLALLLVCCHLLLLVLVFLTSLYLFICILPRLCSQSIKILIVLIMPLYLLFSWNSSWFLFIVLHYICFVCCSVVTLPSFVHRIFYYTSLARWACWHFTKCYDLSF